MKTNIYIDAFNLYYGCLKRTPHRWLDLSALAASLVSKHQVNRIRYFTAKVRTIPGDGDGRQPQRQQVYFRALRTIPNLSIHFGHYLTHKTTMKLVTPIGKQKFAEVFKTEEKGSDVNLATMLLLDGFQKDYEQALVISNDSDLAMPVDVVKSELGLPVGVAFPCSRPGRKQSVTLRKAASFVRPIRANALAKCQFPASLTDAQGTFTKPPKW